MWKKVFYVVLLLMLTMTLPARERNDFDPKKYRAELKEYVVKEAQLTPAEAEKFFTLYDAMRGEERKVFRKIKEIRKERPVTDDDCRKAIVDIDEHEMQLKRIQQQYHQKMLKVLPPSKVMRSLFHAEKFDRSKFRQMAGKNAGAKPMRKGEGHSPGKRPVHRKQQ